MRVNSRGYVERRTTGRSGRSDSSENWRNWWLVKDGATVPLKQVILPKHMVGKRVRFKMEILE
jgi:hypothetical protein|tara:strand:- start:173 stop:361 length:189 start_codon:yes stop_codon:yes gene_type:complete